MRYAYSKHSEIKNKRHFIVRAWLAWEELIGKALVILLGLGSVDPRLRTQTTSKVGGKRTRNFLLFFVFFLIITTPLVYLSLKYVKQVKAVQWWPNGGTSWEQRKQLTLTNNSAANLSSGTTVTITVDTKTLYDSGKLQSDCDDLRILYQPSSSQATEVTRHLVFPSGTTCSTSTTTKVNFKLQAALNTTASSTDYYVYYNNSGASTPSSTDDAFDTTSSINATLVCPFDGSTTCAAGETPSTESGAVRYSGSKSAMSFTSGSYVNGNISVTLDKFTVETWIYLEQNAPVGWVNIPWAGSGACGNYVFKAYSAGLSFYPMSCTGNTISTSGATISFNTWTHVAMTFDSGSVTFYINGTQYSGGAFGASSITLTSYTLAGSWGGAARLYSDLDELRLSNSIRYTSNFIAPTAPFVRDSNTKLLLHFDENGNDPRNTGKTIDDSGNGNHGTITGAKYVAGLVGVDASASDTGNVSRQSYAGHEGIFIEEGTTNKITNPSFDHTTYNTNWDAVGANLTASENTTAPYYKFGSKSLKLIASADAIAGTSNMDTIGIDPNSTATHTLSFYAYDGTTGNVGGTVSSSIVKPVWEGVAQAGGTYTDMGGGWWRVTYATTTTDATNEYGVEAQVSKTIYIEGVQLEALAYATTYTDGTLGTGYSWTGTAHESTSSRTAGALAYAASGNIAGSAGAISFWVNFSYYPSVAAYKEILHSGTWTGNNAISFFVNTANNNQFFLDYKTNGTGNTGRVSTSTYNLRGWHHIVGVWQTNDLRLYISNTQIGQDTTVDTNATFSSAITFDNFFGRSVSDLRIFDTALTSTQVTDLYQAGLAAHSEGNQIDRAGGLDSSTKGESPVAIWHMDEGYGSIAYDSTINANNLTITGPTWSVDSGQARMTGGRALKFDGSNDYGYRTTDGDFDFGTGSFTINGSFRHPSTVSGTDIILARYGTAGYKVYMDSSGYLCFGLDYDSTWNPTDSACSTVSYADSKWHTFSAVKNGTTSLTLYVDSNSVGTDSSLTNSSINTGSNLYLGADSDGSSNPWDGFLDEIVIYPYARSTAQVKSDLAGNQASVILGAQNNNTLTNGLRGYWNLNESTWTVNCSTEDVQDESGNNNDGRACPDTNGPNGGDAGKFGNAGNFEVDDYVEFDDITYSASQAWSASFWIRSEATKSTIPLGRGTSSSYIRTYFNGASSSIGVRNTSGDTESAVTVNMSNNTWYHITATADGMSGDAKMYLNGTYVGVSDPGANGSAITFDRFGRAYPNDNFVLDGDIDEVRIYGRELSPTEVNLLYNFAPGPVAHWKLDENTGTTANDSTGNNNITSAFAGQTTWTAGKFGSGLIFDGTNDVVQTTETTSTDIGATTDSYALSAWMKTTTDYGGNAYIAAKDDASGAYPMALYLNSSEYGCFQISDGTNAPSACGSTALNDGNWHHLSGIRDVANDKVYVYVDGVQITSTTDSTTATTVNDDTLSFGNGGTSYTGYDFNGSIDDIRIYNYARTSKQIVEDMNAGHPAGGSPVGSAIGYWKFDEGRDGACSGGTNDACNSGSAGSTLDGAQSGMSVPATATSGWTNAGKFGKALQFDETDDFVSITDNNAIDFSTSISLSAWVYPDDCTGTGDGRQEIITKYVAYYFNLESTTCKPSFYFYGLSSPGYHTANTGLTIGTWSHIVATWDGSSVNIFINGKLDKTVTGVTGTGTTNASALTIGAANSTRHFDGYIDEVKIYNYALTADEVKLDYNNSSSIVLGALSDNSSYQKTAANQEYCVPGDGTSCVAPVGEWKLDEKTGQYGYDTSGNNNTGTLGSTSGADANDPAWISGKVGQALSFDGGDYVSSIPYSNFENLGAFTIDAWIKGTSGLGTTSQVIISQRANNLGSIGLQIFGNSVLWVYINNAGYSCGTLSWNNNQWYHLAVSYNGANATCYRDGVQTASPAVTGTTGSKGTSFLFGVWDNVGSLSQYFNGSIDNVRIYNYARSAAQIAWDYNRGLPIAHYKFDECTGATANDASGNSYTGTIYPVTEVNTATGTCSSGTSTEMWNDGTSGKFNSSLGFDGSDDYVGINDFPLGGNQVSVSGWIKFTNRAGQLYNSLFAKQSEVIFYVPGSANNFAFYIYGQTADCTTIDAYSGLSNDTWYHFTGVYDGTAQTKTIYINGKQVASQGCNAGILDNTVNTISLGSAQFGSTYYTNGLIDDVRIYNYPLTIQQIRNIYNGGSAIRFGPSSGNP
ncbi:hypothetical protein A3H80_04655 [Candidatus Roizmanbacteria bacterium RIFCSPLOWO2_02_FULL_37_19]|uniref:LamG-like jellyroll fold domain-containing protein n=1 Tax=Candidatus Roizmanbacteria bacterium RIFCSPHIGHO2_02_FULL_37_24 TaxID=1802037 RepID=A0A1F7GUL3_9BACT|nr:MAG: hypothetical protein A2862_04215 [Candidatus Roizmanbacteria bacterium RIFCSPHIGHO2_01_FULL_38_41]OGK22767.1 MAG: hypothetical protein A3C24_01700 [Candidatus Roizmanbacteria bacterium RIFCSPHIGHO2_02_FULL_37_24]OGK32102.1 MAG: hypothetical protein A3E10_02590 [Candidatus Roizmanbacteria bacterium RIFCSPHIGHO2_12_FULL_37_23]OGK45736.1 MAG: hypothetical protein A2956_03290 [Candidatus Roizmanbacteria bacterium RIFCSPLOWO2_01_FULL_37_57]OGK54144.1 MAG: hypothetical protein A3H80_04655 [Ca